MFITISIEFNNVYYYLHNYDNYIKHFRLVLKLEKKEEK